MISAAGRHTICETEFGRPRVGIGKEDPALNTKKLGRTAARAAEGAIQESREIGGRLLERYGGKNPLLVRKKIEMQDIYYRKKDPEKELLRIEMGCDTELWVLAFLASLVLFCLAWKIANIGKRMRIRHAHRKR
jgi:hypothetical protein